MAGSRSKFSTKNGRRRSRSSRPDLPGAIALAPRAEPPLGSPSNWLCRIHPSAQVGGGSARWNASEIMIVSDRAEEPLGRVVTRPLSTGARHVPPTDDNNRNAARAIFGGMNRNRTCVSGFADRPMATLASSPISGIDTATQLADGCMKGDPPGLRNTLHLAFDSLHKSSRQPKLCPAHFVARKLSQPLHYRGNPILSPGAGRGADRASEVVWS